MCSTTEADVFYFNYYFIFERSEKIILLKYHNSRTEELFAKRPANLMNLDTGFIILSI